MWGRDGSGLLVLRFFIKRNGKGKVGPLRGRAERAFRTQKILFGGSFLSDRLGLGRQGGFFEGLAAFFSFFFSWGIAR